MGSELDGERLDKALAASGSISRGLARRAIAAGGVFVEGRRVLVSSRAVRAGQELRAHLEEGAGRAPAVDEPRILDPWRIVYQDRDLVAVDKPPGVSAQATLTSSTALPELVAEATGRPALLVHRLDLETSGVTVLARHKKAVTEMARAFREGLVGKTYLAVTVGRPGPMGRRTHAADVSGAAAGDAWTDEASLPATGTFDWNLAKDPAGRGSWRAVREGGIPAVTKWSLVEVYGTEIEEGGFCTVRLHPETGRTHQIRVHLKEAGAPILGDRRYGAPTFLTLPDGVRVELPRMLLHAAALSLPHPRTGETLELKAAVPSDMRDAVAALGGNPDLS